MSELIQVMKTRRSIRDYEFTPVEREKLEQIVQAAAWAPSGMNTQSWKFVVVTNPKLLQNLSNAVDRESCFFYQAPALLLVANHRNYANAVPDTAVAMQNSMLAATELGLGSCWVSQLSGRCDEEAIRPILTKCGVPRHDVVYAAVALGYARAPVAEVPRRDNRIVWAE